MKKLISTLPPLQPVTVWDAQTGEQLTQSEYTQPVKNLLQYVTEQTTVLFQTRGAELEESITHSEKIGSPNSYARQRGYTSDYKKLPAEVKAKSRINELILHKLVSETSAYVLNKNPFKQPPVFHQKINLGAADKQLSTLSITGNTLTLLWKCWDKELLLDFIIPDYVMKRTVVKWSLPTVQISKKTGSVVFYFSFQEEPAVYEPSGLTAGLDLGRVVPYTIAVVNQEGNRTADYVTSGRLRMLNKKRERLIMERKQVLAKAAAYKVLGVFPEKQELLQGEAGFKRGKAARVGYSLALQLGSEVAGKLVKHRVNALHVEDLSWVAGAKYGSRWNHSGQQEALTHSLARLGVPVRKVPAKNTSKLCYKCSAVLVVNAKSRTVFCGECKSRLDRDFNAALNIAKSKSFPVSYSKNGNNCSSQEQVIENISQESGAGIRTSLSFIT